MDHPNIVKVRELTDKISVVHTSRLRLFKYPAEMTSEELKVLASIDVDEHFVEKNEIVASRIERFVCDGQDTSRMKIHGSIGTL